MASKEDARPFVALRQDSEDFKTLVDADIEDCIALFDSKIKSLICDPDSLGNPFGEARRASAQMEFSRSKYDIFINTKSFFNEIEEKWTRRIAEIKNLFLENVEIFLANTKLEVKVPSEKVPSPFDTKKNSIRTPRNKKADSNSSSSLNLLVSSITKNFPEVDVQNIDKGERYPWNGAWLEREINGKFIHEAIEKRQKSGVAYCLVCQKELTYGSRGFNSLKDHIRTRRHEKRQENSAIPAINVPLLRKNEREVEENISENIFESRTSVRGSPRRKTLVSEPQKNENTAGSRVVGRVAVAQTPKKVTFMIDDDNDLSKCMSATKNTPKPLSRRRSAASDLLDKALEDIDLSDITPSRYSSRRKTMFTSSEQEDLSDLIPGRASRSQSKRKTIGGSSDLKSESSPKRLKLSGKTGSPLVSGKRGAKANLLECDDDDESSGDGGYAEDYSEWVALKGIGAIPTNPAIYELKVWRAKKSAFIGSCDNLRQKLTLHKLGQNSGHKHLDKFLERNLQDVQVRYEVTPSVSDAKVEVKNRINNFVAQYKTTPAYN